MTVCCDRAPARTLSLSLSSRRYAGAGIFRHVHLGTVPAVHAVTFGGVGVTTPQHQIDLVAKTATVGVTTAVHNAGKAAAATTVGVRLFSPAGELVAESSAPMSIPVQIAAGATVNVTQALPLTNVAFWGPDTPHLYLATVTVTSTTGTDAVNVSFGVRHITFDSTNGFRLNGAALNLKKTEHTLGIIQDTYSDVDVFFLQEVATTFIETAGNAPGLAQFKVLAPDILGIVGLAFVLTISFGSLFVVC